MLRSCVCGEGGGWDGYISVSCSCLVYCMTAFPLIIVAKDWKSKGGVYISEATGVARKTATCTTNKPLMFYIDRRWILFIKTWAIL